MEPNKSDSTKILNVDRTDEPIPPATSNPPSFHRRRRSKKRKVRRKRKRVDVALDAEKVVPSVLVEAKPKKKRKKRKKVKTAMDGFLGRIGGTTSPRTPSFVVPPNDDSSDNTVGTLPQEEDEHSASWKEECQQQNDAATLTTSPAEDDTLAPKVDAENDKSDDETPVFSNTQVKAEEQFLATAAGALGGDPEDDAGVSEVCQDDTLATAANSLPSIDAATVSTPIIATMSSLSPVDADSATNDTVDVPKAEAVPPEHTYVVSEAPQHCSDGEDMAKEESNEQDHQIQSSTEPLQSVATETTEATVESSDVEADIHAVGDDSSGDEENVGGDEIPEDGATSNVMQHSSVESSAVDDAESGTEGDAQQDTSVLQDVAITRDTIESPSTVGSRSGDERGSGEDEDNSDVEEDGDESDAEEGDDDKDDEEADFSLESSQEIVEATEAVQDEGNTRNVDTDDDDDDDDDDDVDSSDNGDETSGESDTDAETKRKDIVDDSDGDSADEVAKSEVLLSNDEIVANEDVGATDKLHAEAASLPEMRPDEPTDDDGNQSQRGIKRRALSNNDILVSAVTWNLAEESPSEADADFIKKFRKGNGLVDRASDLVLFSGQECENIKPRRTEGRRSREFRRLMVTMLGKDYVPLALHLLGGIQFGLFCRRDVLDEIEQAYVADVTCGVGNVFHNKGGIGCFVQMKARSSGLEHPQQRASKVRLLFVAAHMVSYYSKTPTHLFLLTTP